MKKPKSILDPSFRYTSSSSTDIRKTFARVRREMKQEVIVAPPDPKVTVLRKERK